MSHNLNGLAIVVLILTGCSHPTPEVPSGAECTMARSSLHVESFRFMDSNTTLHDLIGKVGKPNCDVGSGIHVYMYIMADGSTLLVGSDDGSSILYVMHDDLNLYQGRRVERGGAK